MAALVVRRQAPTPRQCAYISGGYRIRPYGPHANWRLPGAGRCKHRPLQNGSRGHLAPEGSNGEAAKSVKKRAALLHVLAFCCFDLLFGVPRGERLAAHNERRQFAAQTRSCGYSPRWGEHCSLPGFAALNRGPLLATPQSPRPGCCAVAQRSKPQWGFEAHERARFAGWRPSFWPPSARYRK